MPPHPEKCNGHCCDSWDYKDCTCPDCHPNAPLPLAKEIEELTFPDKMPPLHKQAQIAGELIGDTILKLNEVIRAINNLRRHTGR